MPDYIFISWEAVGEVALTAVLVYVALVAMLRISGKRTLAKFNAFDFVVTVALGSMVATTILNAETTVAAGAVGIAVLLGAQAAVSLSVTRWRGVQRLVKSQPQLLYYQGTFRTDALTSERIATEEIRLAVRAAGHARLDQVLAIVLETDGTMSVIPDDGREAPLDALANVRLGDVELDAGERRAPAARWQEPAHPPSSAPDRSTGPARSHE